jgi:integral membrane sensor domain MASE1
MNKPAKKFSFFYRNGLTIVFMSLFVITLIAQGLTGWKQHNEDLKEESAKTITLGTYLQSGHFISATFENFESEFLQMALYVLMTISLRQIGSAESKKLDEPEDVDREPQVSPDAPWAVRKGGWILKIYSNSLSLCFGILFFFSWAMHLYGSWQNHNVEQLAKHLPKETVMEYLGKPEFWFETFQNWQSEFLSVASIVFFTIYLRQKGSSESKPVDAPNMETGK